MKDHYNRELNAQNVFKIKISKTIIGALHKYFKDHIQNSTNEDFHTISPQWNSDIKWTSVNNSKTYNQFLRIFDTLNLSDIQKFIDGEIICYSIFFVTRSHCHKPNFHTDFSNTENNAFTLMTPLTNIDNDSRGHLLYKDVNDKTAVYKYKRGECIVFGDKFLHSTQPYSQKEVTFLCFTFGSNKRKHWKKIFNCIRDQQARIMRYDGIYVNSVKESKRLEFEEQ